jgi:hypothetical protein
MTFLELLHNVNTLTIQSNLIECYPHQVKNYEGYILVAEQLKNMVPVKHETNMRICLELVSNYGETEVYVEVNGKNGTIDEHTNKEESFSLSFVPWNELLLMPIDQQTLKKYPLEVILVHILYDITFWGFTESQRNKVSKQLDETKEEAGEELK